MSCGKLYLLVIGGGGSSEKGSGLCKQCNVDSGGSFSDKDSAYSIKNRSFTGSENDIEDEAEEEEDIEDEDAYLEVID